MDFYLKKFVDLKELTILETVKKKKKKARAWSNLYYVNLYSPVQIA
jgi:hypothetical protein